MAAECRTSMDTSGTGCDAAAAMEGLTVEGLSARQLELMKHLLESQLKVERERMQRMLAAERNAIRQEVVEALAARGLEEQPGLDEPYEEFTETGLAHGADELTADDDTSPSPYADGEPDVGEDSCAAPALRATPASEAELSLGGNTLGDESGKLLAEALQSEATRAQLVDPATPPRRTWTTRHPLELTAHLDQLMLSP